MTRNELRKLHGTPEEYFNQQDGLLKLGILSGEVFREAVSTYMDQYLAAPECPDGDLLITEEKVAS